MNRNGDLTDDGDGSYDRMEKDVEAGRGGDPGTMIYKASRTMRASWSTGRDKANACEVGVVFRRFHSTSKR